MDASSVLSDDLSDYDVISDPGHRSLDSSIADIFSGSIHEPPPTEEAQEKFATVRLTAQEIRNNARLSLGTAPPVHTGNGTIKSRRQSLSADQQLNRMKRIYVDGSFDGFNAGHALQLRQAKLSFPAVHLIVGVFSDELCDSYGYPITVPYVERCEVVRHCRWVDEVLPDAPWQIEEGFTRERRIDYVVFDEGATVSPAYDKVRVKGYDSMKRLGKVILTKPTTGLTVSNPVSIPVPITPTSPPGQLRSESHFSLPVHDPQPPEPLVEF
ncbi:choline-phosphate cytidylyltransferase [Moniliophthora roreri MCA 2997]|nr:choline-phosphate cytidylyltransferase [Moniliophthora roreri MCA 2997]KAI3619594.1 choline-phosphate cytidylyltransferase [Moniliophthora roreri]